jgi:hypothetical protein
MKLKLTASLDGVLELPEASSSISATRDEITFTLLSDASRRVNQVSVTIALTAAQGLLCKSLQTHPPEGTRLDVVFPPELYATAVQQLQALESDLSFGYRTSAVRRIRWDEPTLTLVPENAEEDANINAWDISIKRSYPEPPAVMTEPGLREMVLAAPVYDALVVPKAFLREGHNEFRARRFVQAFYNFYFVIEGVFADGRSREKEVMKTFQDSKELRAATRVTLETFARDAPQRARFEKLVKDAGFAFDAEGIWRYLFRTRGELHHYFLGSSRQHGTPFSHDQFEAPALLALILAGQCIMVRIITINGGSLDA